jgi:hypothetical protein
MVRMCRILDSGARLISVSSSSSGSRPSSSSTSTDEQDTPLTVSLSPTPLYTFSWPRGGMFIWLRMHLESHPLWGTPSPKLGGKPLDGLPLSTALMVFLTTKPFRVLAGNGAMFSANDEVRQRMGWAYFRVCFAAETEDNVDVAASRFVDGVHAYWRVQDVAVIEKLLESLEDPGKSGLEEGEEEVQREDAEEHGLFRLASYMGC